MTRIITRYAHDEHHARQIANGMEAAGAEVFSVTPRKGSLWRSLKGTDPNDPLGALVVWARIRALNDDDTLARIDQAIENERLKDDGGR